MKDSSTEGKYWTKKYNINIIEETIYKFTIRTRFLLHSQQTCSTAHDLILNRGMFTV